MSAPPPAEYGVIVVGAGHAGCEAALAAARLGVATCLMTLNLEHLGALSCNPAVGGLAKGHLVREIDALGGEMGKNADATGIQFRLLNRGKGPAVWSSRAQVDIDLYPKRLRRVCASEPNLWLLEAEAAALLIEGGRVMGVRTALGQEIAARTVVLTTGTFLRGVIHVGLVQSQAGRMGDPPSNALSDQLRELGFSLRRLKTGTTPRLLKRSLDLEGLPLQNGDPVPRMFSFMSRGPQLPQVGCWVTRTSEETHRLVRENLHQAPMYAGVITGTGARYCPSLEDKVVRFPQRDSHQVFLEPQGLESPLVYPNGIPTSLPLQVQIPLVRSLPGCARAHIVRPGYAVEYDMSDPLDLTHALQSKRMAGLFMAGQINGTSGYEEAAAQGLMAGINAARCSRGEGPWTLDRSRAYIGVLIDDLVTRGTNEPYRMFTSRAEYRLSLREDNADLRLTAMGRDLGLVDEARWRTLGEKLRAMEAAREILEQTRLRPGPAVDQRLASLGSAPLARSQSACELLKRPGVGIMDLLGLDPALERLADLPEAAREQVEIQARYAGYEEREREGVARFRAREGVTIPADLDYDDLPGLSREVKEKLSRVKPANLGQAGRVSGVTPAAVAIISLRLAKLGRRHPGDPRS